MKLAAEREIAHLVEAAADLQRICASEDEARRCFTVVDRAEIEENEFNLNLPRYVDTFEPETTKPLPVAVKDLLAAETAASEAQQALKTMLAGSGISLA